MVLGLSDRSPDLFRSWTGRNMNTHPLYKRAYGSKAAQCKIPKGILICSAGISPTPSCAGTKHQRLACHDRLPLFPAECGLKDLLIQN